MGGYSDQFAGDVLRRIGAPVSAANIRRLRAWARAEGGRATYNPFNTTQKEPGAVSINSVGVKSYPSMAVGEQATVTTLTNGRYGPILAALRNPDSTDQQFASAIQNSPWGTSGKLVAKILNAPGPVTAPKGQTGSTTVGTGATQQVGSGDATQVECYWHIPFPGMSTDLCLDNILWGGLALASISVFIVGAAVIAVGAGMKNPALQKTVEVGSMVVPVGRATKALGGAAKAGGSAVASRTTKSGRSERAAEAAYDERYDKQGRRRSPNAPDRLADARKARASTSSSSDERAAQKRLAQRYASSGSRRVATREEAGF
jgi:hypothetical protein